jgi:hypothetical protein
MLLVGGNDIDPSVRLLYPHISGMKEIVALKGHSRAISSIHVDAAGRCFITASRGDHSILIWDGLTFNCERQIRDVSIGDLVVADDLIVISSITTPFLRFYGKPDVYRREKLKLKEKGTVVDDDNNDSFLSAIREPYFCQSVLKGTVLAPSTTLAPIISTDNPLFYQVLWRWNRQYKRKEEHRCRMKRLKPGRIGVTRLSTIRRRNTNINEQSDSDEEDILIESSSMKKMNDDKEDKDNLIEFNEGGDITNKSNIIKSKRHPANQISHPHLRAHFSDSDGDDDDFFVNHKKDNNNDDDDDNNDANDTTNKYYLPKILNIRDVLEDE